MKYCPYCHRWNLGRPQLCYYCGRTWYVRLCPRGHENPPDAQFCGTCGSADLSDTAGPRPIWILILRFVFLFALLIIAYCIAQGFLHFTIHQSFPYIVSICFLIIAYRLGLSVLPAILKKPFLAFNKAVMNGILNLLRWVWERIKMVFS